MSFLETGSSWHLARHFFLLEGRGVVVIESARTAARTAYDNCSVPKSDFYCDLDTEFPHCSYNNLPCQQTAESNLNNFKHFTLHFTTSYNKVYSYKMIINIRKGYVI